MWRFASTWFKLVDRFKFNAAQFKSAKLAMEVPFSVTQDVQMHLHSKDFFCFVVTISTSFSSFFN